MLINCKGCFGIILPNEIKVNENKYIIEILEDRCLKTTTTINGVNDDFWWTGDPWANDA